MATNQEILLKAIEGVKKSQDRLFKLYEKQEKDIRIIQDFIIEKNVQNGHTKDCIDTLCEDYKTGDKSLEERLTTIEGRLWALMVGLLLTALAVLLK